MNDNTKKARELLASEYEKDSPDSALAQSIREGKVTYWSDEVAIRAIIAALSEKEQAGQETIGCGGCAPPVYAAPQPASAVPDDAEWYVSEHGSQTVDIAHAGWQLSLMLQADGQVGWAYRLASGVSGRGVGIDRFAESFYDCVLTPAAGAVPDRSELIARGTATVEDLARHMFTEQADRLAAPWDRQLGPTKQYWRKKAAAMLAAAKEGDHA